MKRLVMDGRCGKLESMGYGVSDASDVELEIEDTSVFWLRETQPFDGGVPHRLSGNLSLNSPSLWGFMSGITLGTRIRVSIEIDPEES